MSTCQPTSPPARLHPGLVLVAGLLSGLVVALVTAVPGFADDASADSHPNQVLQEARPPAAAEATSDAATTAALPPPGPARFPLELRTIDGTDARLPNPNRGAAGIPFLRLAPAAYDDAKAAPASAGRPSAREVSNAVVAQTASSPSRVTDFMWQWGQFLDHDVDLTPGVTPTEAFDVLVPRGDAFFDPAATGLVRIPLARSLYQEVGGVRQQVNAITAFIDASNVYGSDDERATALRTLDGSGKLKTSAGNLLPFNVDGLANAPGPSPTFFLAGDVRANEQVGLTAMHVLFVREHNHWAEVIHADEPGLDDEAIYQKARAIVAGEMQAITYREFLPILLGRGALPPYAGYRPEVDPGISNEFATASYRFGHSMLTPQLLRLGRNNRPIAAGNLSLKSAFFNPSELIDHGGIDPIVRGLARQPSQVVDVHIVDEVRNFLFGPPGSGGFDLASLNLQRGRDHGLASYNGLREAVGRRRARNFGEISPDPAVRNALASVYDSVDAVDAWVGGLAEPHRQGALVGETIFRVLRDQFLRLRDGDRFWYESYLPPAMVELVNQQTLARVIRRNTGIGNELPRNVWRVPPPG